MPDTSLPLRSAAPALSLVVPCYNEEEVLPEFHRRATAALEAIGLPFEIVYVNDGSRDGTLPLMLGLAEADPRTAVVNLSRNFGKEIALTAGLDHARGAEAVVVIDADLQDPPEVIADLVAAWRRGFDIAYAQRTVRHGEGWVKRTTAAAFYRLMQRVGGKVELPRDTGDFRLMSRRSLDALLRLREQHRFMKGLFAWVGFPSVAVPYERAPRAAGTTKWNWWKLWNLSLEGITSFTVGPLKFATYLGLAVSFGAVLYLVQLLVRTLIFGNAVAGYPSLMAVVLFLGGVQMTMLGIIGEYLGRIFNETKGRPLYLVERHIPSASTADQKLPQL
ncbi:MAG: glycosyltransferase family 2 protein [Acetobacteraceae bacterium]|nr:glycosyltransferase family 2 protein [Acetobacteraceae bacterium]